MAASFFLGVPVGFTAQAVGQGWVDGSWMLTCMPKLDFPSNLRGKSSVEAPAKKSQWSFSDNILEEKCLCCALMSGANPCKYTCIDIHSPSRAQQGFQAAAAASGASSPPGARSPGLFIFLSAWGFCYLSTQGWEHPQLQPTGGSAGTAISGWNSSVQLLLEAL